MKSILTWLDDHAIVMCVYCWGLFFKKDIIKRRFTTGGFATLCKNCDNDLFHPFTKGRL